MKSVSATVQLADPETERELAENKKELAKLRFELEKAQNEVKKLKTEAVQTGSEVEKLKSGTETLKTEAKRLNAELAKLRTENIQKSTENAQKTAELARRAEEKANLEAELTVLRRESAKYQGENSSLKAEISKLKSEVSKSMTELQAENSLLSEANQNLRSELLDTLERCARLSNRVKRMEQSAAGVLETLSPVYAGVRENELADALDLTMKSGMELVGKSTVVCEMLYPLIVKMGLADVEKARLRVAIDALSAENQSFARLSVPSVLPDQFRKCRVLEISETPETVILNAGYRDGVRVNMKLQAGSGDKACALRIVAVRPFVSAAVVLSGRIGDLGVGQEVLAVEDKK